jgi:hypothetical protein
VGRFLLGDRGHFSGEKIFSIGLPNTFAMAKASGTACRNLLTEFAARPG